MANKKWTYHKEWSFASNYFIFFKKLEYRFLVETTKIEYTSLPFKTALSEANVKINKMGTTDCTYHKEWIFASNYIFLENFVLVLEPLTKS